MKIEELNLAALKYFVDAVELASLTASAEKNFVSRPAVSQAILRLEEWRGHTLLEHGKRTFVLTSNGKKFYRQAKSNLELLRQGFVDETDQNKSLKIGCSASLIELIFSAIKKPLRAAPSPTITFGTTTQLIELLKSERINLAVVVDSGQTTSSKSIALGSGKFRLFSKSGKYQGHLITTEDRPEVRSFQKAMMKEKVSFTSHLRVESWSVAARLAQMGQGCCLLPDFLKPVHLKAVRTPKWKSSYTIRVLIRNPRLLSPLEEQVLALLHEKC